MPAHVVTEESMRCQLAYFSLITKNNKRKDLLLLLIA